MTEESLWTKPKKKRKIKRKVPKDVSMAEANDIADEYQKTEEAQEPTQRVEAEAMVYKEDTPQPKSVVPPHTGPAKRSGDVWLDNDGRRSFMYRGYTCRPGTGTWVSTKSENGLRNFVNASKKSSS